MTRVVGLDLSLTSTGMSDGKTTHVVNTYPEEGLESRLNWITRRCISFVNFNSELPGCRRAGLVVIEGAAFGSKGDAVDQLAGLRMLVRVELWRLGVPFAMVPPTTLKTYTTGNGRATKAQMVASLRARHGFDLTPYKISQGKYDMADGYALAAMGYARVGEPLPTTGPPAPMASMLAVKWPEGF